MRPAETAVELHVAGDLLARFPETAALAMAAGETVLCRAFDHRDSAATCRAADSVAAVFFAEAAVAELGEALAAAGGRTGAIVAADAARPRALLPEP